MENRDRSYQVKPATCNCVRICQRQVEEIETALREAEAGLFATDEEVRQCFARWTS
jgi:predicted transcriptional regulator